MATPPAATVRGTPSGLPLRDGFATMITFENNPTISLWEKSTTPPGKDNGDAIDTSTFHNTLYRTKYPRVLTEITDGAFTAAYDPGSEVIIQALVGINQDITVTFNDLTTIAYRGYLKSFVPQEVTDGDQPEASVEFVVTNTDVTFLEEGPVAVGVAGT